MKEMKKGLARKREENPDFPPKSRILDWPIRRWLSGESSLPEDPLLADAVREIGLSGGNQRVCAHHGGCGAAHIEVYEIMDPLPGTYQPVEPIPYAGVLKPEEAERGRRRKRESLRMEFRQELAAMIRDLPQCEEVEIEIPGNDARHG